MLTEKQQKIADQIWGKINKAQHILLHFHPSPDPDSVGSALAMMLVVKNLDKKVTVIQGDSEFPESMLHFPGANQITKKSYSEIDTHQFDLFIILDSSTKQMIQKNKVTFPPQMTTIVIDHHVSNPGFGDICLIAPEYPAVGQLLYNLFNYWQIKISPEIAINLFMAIYTDTGGFKYEGTTYETLQVATELAKINPNFSQTIFQYENSNEPENLIFQGLALNSIEMFFNNKVAISAIPYQELEKRNIKPKHIDKATISNQLRSVKGWNLGISLIETSPNKVSINFRTRNPIKYDVSKIATALGGGGHPAASGTLIRKSFDEVKKQLLLTIQKTYPPLGSC